MEYQYQYGHRGSISSSPPPGFLPSDLPNLLLWPRFNTGITVTGSGVSNWADQSGNGNDLLQGSDTNRPSAELNGTVLFNGTDNSLVALPFASNQPITTYLLLKQITWINARIIFDCDIDLNMIMQQIGTSPELRINAGVALDNISLPLNTYGITIALFNGASSLIQLDNEAPVEGNAGSKNMGGFVLGRRANPNVGQGPGNHSNIQVAEVAVFNAAHTAGEITQMVDYLNSVKASIA